MYNWNQFRNFPKFKNMSDQERARQYFLYQSNVMMEQSANAALAPAAAAAAAGAGGGGRLPQPKEFGYGIQSFVFGIDNDTLDGFATLTLNFETDEFKKTDFGFKLTEFLPPSWPDIKNFQNAGYAFPCNGQNDNSGIKRWVFIDAAGSILDTIDINENENPVLYYVMINSYIQETGMINVYNRYENSSWVGTTFLWFNGIDKPAKYDLDYFSYNIVANFDYSDRKGNFLFKFDDLVDGQLRHVYLIGKKMTLVKSYLYYDPIYGNINSYGYVISTGEVTGFVLRHANTNIYLNVVFIASDHTIIKDNDVSSYEYTTLSVFPYGSRSKVVFLLEGGNIYNSATLLQANGATKNMAKKDFIVKAWGYDFFQQYYCSWSSNEKEFLPESFYFVTCSSKSGNGYGYDWSDYELHYISGDEDKWNTFEKASIWIEENPYVSGKGLYIKTDNGGSSSIYLLYLSGGKETYTEIAQKSWQNGTPATEPFGVSSVIITYRGEDGNQPYFKILKEGKLIESPFDSLLAGDMKRFGIRVLKSNTTSDIYWYGEDAGKIEKIVLEEGSSMPLDSYNDSPLTYNNIHPGCQTALLVLRESLSSGYYKYHLLSPSSTSVTESTLLAGYNFNMVRSGDRFQMQWTSASNSQWAFVRLYTAEDGLVAEYSADVNVFDSPSLYGKRSAYSLWTHTYSEEEPYQIMTYILLGNSGAKELALTGGAWLTAFNDTKAF